ncbi:PQQ-dependent sugar dehydrogenase [Streptomyces sp. NA02950]|uniref:PQQ-dependent sugar dehydrogenase n=1 Tax=Streptomyces sp. NA02950 TaxID=2742137 RepID=UPI001591A473|nr:PQQ-dependent sugar dehydrogenase [Streptomyces sp. NA02950]QKV92401.1 PQQ-dependent sugar dehydrogenase [Streptomyces sp. NA02950]
MERNPTVRRPRVIPVIAAAAATLLLVAGCSSDGDSTTGPEDRRSSPAKPGSESDSASPGAPSPTASAAPRKGSVKVERTLTTKLDSPWGVAPLPGGDLLVSSRDTGKIFKIAADTGKKTELGSVPGVSPAGEGGLLGLAVSSDFGSDHMVYAYFTTDSDNRIARMMYDDKRPAGDQLGAPDTIFKGIPKGAIHNGGRIAFGPDKMLYAGTGESGDRGLAQDLDSFGGKILRMTPEGEPVHGNPDPDSVVYSYGHRNVQGLAWDRDKRLWASEFGQDTWDELNLIKPGKNYGWPEAEGKAGEKAYVDPLEQWKPTDASPSGIAIAKGSVWMAGLRGERLWRIPLKGERPVAKPRSFLVGKYGRLRSVVATDDGGLWVTTSNTDGRGEPGKQDDRILKLKIT